MSNNNTKTSGIFITLEGGDGAGKSTQISLLRFRLEEAGHEVLSTREPGGTAQAEAIRDFILSGKAESLGGEVEAMLFTAARLDHVEEVIAPAVASGKIVLCDRFIDSTRVYQGATGKVEVSYLNTLEALIKDIAWPDLTLILDLDPVEGLKRMEERRDGSADPDRFEKEGTSVQEERRAAFLAIAKAEPKRCKVIDASAEAEEVHERIWKLVGPLVKRKRGAPRE